MNDCTSTSLNENEFEAWRDEPASTPVSASMTVMHDTPSTLEPASLPTAVSAMIHEIEFWSNALDVMIEKKIPAPHLVAHARDVMKLLRTQSAWKNRENLLAALMSIRAALLSTVDTTREWLLLAGLFDPTEEKVRVPSRLIRAKREQTVADEDSWENLVRNSKAVALFQKLAEE